MNLPLVSIIIPCFNGMDYVSEAIQSALDQSYPMSEVIVIDDGSTDDSLSIIKGFGSKIRWETGPNRGGGHARNRGLKSANGAYIQFLDADDLLDADKLERQMITLMENDADVLYSDCRQFHIENPARVRTLRVRPHPDDAVVTALRPQNIQTSAAIVKKELLIAVGGFREDLPCCQERDLFMRLAGHGAGFRYFPGVFHTVRKRSDSVSNDEVRVLTVLRELLVAFYSNLENAGALTEERKIAFATLTANGARRLLRFGHTRLARDHFDTACKMHRDGGLRGIYSRPGHLLVKAFGPEFSERILMPIKKSLAIFTG